MKIQKLNSFPSFFKLVLLLICINVNLFAQDSTSIVDTKQPEMFNWFAYPFAFYTPETNFAFGAGGIAYFRTSRIKNTRPSKVTASAYYSINNQYLISLAPSVYFNQNKNEITAEIYFENSIDEYYGTGSNSPDIEEPQYRYNNFSIDFKIKHKFFEGLSFTFVYNFMNFNIADTKNNPFLNGEDVYGIFGGITSGLGFGVSLDTRDNVFYPLKGYFTEFDGVYFADEFGSDYDFNRYLLDLRYYYSFTDDDNVLALQGYAASAGGTPPFYSLPKLGGQYRMRGYFEGRYRDKNYLMAQVEYRKELFWRISGILFMGAGDVGENFSDFKFKNIKYSIGGGVRFVIDKSEKINVRADIGFGKNAFGFYFGIEEAF